MPKDPLQIPLKEAAQLLGVRKALSGHSTAKMDELYTSHARIEDIRRALG